jgi:Ca2+-binding RTX toxin-like protein
MRFVILGADQLRSPIHRNSEPLDACEREICPSPRLSLRLELSLPPKSDEWEAEYSSPKFRATVLPIWTVHSGADSLIGGDGNDTLRGDYGADKPLGGAGSDLLTG